MRAAAAAAILILWSALAPHAWADPQFPKLTGRVVDAANVIPDDEEARLTQKLAALEQQSHRQVVIATIPDLQGNEISDYSYQLGRAWGIGQKGVNNGVVFVIAPRERKVWITVGYGLEPVLTDGMTFLITSQQVIPRFKQGDLPGGVEAGTDAIIKQLTLPPAEAQKIAAEANQQRAGQGGDLSIGHVIFILIIIFFFVVPILRSMFGGRGRRSGWGGPIIWMPGGFGDDDDRGGGGFGGFGGGGGGGGGFSGGGGSFGGGGAGGSW